MIFTKEREQFNNKFVNKLIGKDSQSLLSLTFSIYRTISSIVIVKKTPTINLVISLIYHCFLIDYIDNNEHHSCDKTDNRNDDFFGSVWF